MQIVRHAKYVGTLIGLDGCLHRLAAPRKNFIRRVLKSYPSSNILVERLCEFKIYAISVLNFTGSLCAPDKATFNAENHALQCATASPYKAIPFTLLGIGSICGLGPDFVAFIPSVWRLAFGFQRAHPFSAEVWKESVRHAGTIALLSLLYFPLGNISFFSLPWPSTQRMHLILFLGWTVMTFLIMCSKTIDRKLPLGCFQTNSINKTLLVLSLAVSRVLGLISRHCVAGILHHMKMFRVHHILDSLLVSFASYVMGFVSHGGFTVQCMITLAVLDAR